MIAPIISVGININKAKPSHNFQKAKSKSMNTIIPTIVQIILFLINYINFIILIIY